MKGENKVEKVNKKKSKTDFSVKVPPKKCRTDETKLSWLKKRINGVYVKIKGREISSTHLAIKLGHYLIAAKEISNKKFKAFVDDNLPFTLRTAERKMKLAMNVNIEKYPDLCIIGESRLLSLIDLAGEMNLHNYLKKNEIPQIFDKKDPVAIRDFIEAVKTHLAEKKKKPAIHIHKTLSNLSKTLNKYINEIEFSSDERLENVDIKVIDDLVDMAGVIITKLKNIRIEKLVGTEEDVECEIINDEYDDDYDDDEWEEEFAEDVDQAKDDDEIWYEDNTNDEYPEYDGFES